MVGRPRRARDFAATSRLLLLAERALNLSRAFEMRGDIRPDLLKKRLEVGVLRAGNQRPIERVQHV